MRILEYTHGLENKKYKDEKLLFYLMKGAVLIIEDWWIKIMKKKGKYNFRKKNRNKVVIKNAVKLIKKKKI